MLIETSQMQRLIIALGHPTYGLSVVLFALLLSSGIGSFLTAGITPDGAGRGPPPPAGAGRVLAVSASDAGRRALDRADDHPGANRCGGGALFPAGLLMGMAFPLGMKLAPAARELTPWLWGLNGAASVLASVLGVCIALTWSISTAFWAGWLCYVVALAAFVGAARRARVTERRPSQQYASQSWSVPLQRRRFADWCGA